MLTPKQLDAKREYLDNLEPSVGRTAAYQILDDLEDAHQLIASLHSLLDDLETTSKKLADVCQMGKEAIRDD